MAKRTRLIIDVPEEVRLAVRLEATRLDRGVSDLVTEVLRKHFAAAIRDALKYTPKKEKDE